MKIGLTEVIIMMATIESGMLGPKRETDFGWNSPRSLSSQFLLFFHSPMPCQTTTF